MSPDSRQTCALPLVRVPLHSTRSKTVQLGCRSCADWRGVERFVFAPIHCPSFARVQPFEPFEPFADACGSKTGCDNRRRHERSSSREPSIHLPSSLAELTYIVILQLVIFRDPADGAPRLPADTRWSPFRRIDTRGPEWSKKVQFSSGTSDMCIVRLARTWWAEYYRTVYTHASTSVHGESYMYWTPRCSQSRSEVLPPRLASRASQLCSPRSERTDHAA